MTQYCVGADKLHFSLFCPFLYDIRSLFRIASNVRTKAFPINDFSVLINIKIGKNEIVMYRQLNNGYIISCLFKKFENNIEINYDYLNKLKEKHPPKETEEFIDKLLEYVNYTSPSTFSSNLSVLGASKGPATKFRVNILKYPISEYSCLNLFFSKHLNANSHFLDDESSFYISLSRKKVKKPINVLVSGEWKNPGIYDTLFAGSSFDYGSYFNLSYSIYLERKGELTQSTVCEFRTVLCLFDDATLIHYDTSPTISRPFSLLYNYSGQDRDKIRNYIVVSDKRKFVRIAKQTFLFYLLQLFETDYERRSIEGIFNFVLSL